MPERPGPKVIVVMPARQAAATLEATFEAIPKDEVDEVILVDDSSTDETVRLGARAAAVTSSGIPTRSGYGANQKTCYLEALQHDADVVVMLHPDGQYEPELIPSMVEPILSGEADLVLGSRLLVPGAALAAGMPRWKYVANRFLTRIENRIMGTELSEAHTGYRAYSRRAAVDGALPAQLPRLRLRLGAAHAGLPLRLRDQGGPGTLPLLRRGVLGRLQERRRLRAEDAMGGPSPAAPPLGSPSLLQVPAIGISIEVSGWQPEVPGRAGSPRP